MVYEMLKSVQAGGFGFGNVMAIVVHFKWDGDKLKKLFGCITIRVHCLFSWIVGKNLSVF
jgi:hypothetical protein